MNKDQLAQELRQKLKLGIKPSDLKKQGKNSQIPTPPDSPIIEPIDKKTKQKQGSENISTSPIEIEPIKSATNRDKSSVKNLDKSKLKQLQDQVNFHANTANNYLLNLQTTMAKLDQIELTNQELQEQNEKLTKIIQEQKTSSKNTENIQAPEANFTCSSCARIFNIELIKTS